MLSNIHFLWILTALIALLFMYSLRLKKLYKSPANFSELNTKAKILVIKMAQTRHGLKPFPNIQWISLSEIPLIYAPGTVTPLLSTALFLAILFISAGAEVSELEYLPAVIFSAAFYIAHGMTHSKFLDKYLIDLEALALDFVKANARAWIESLYKFIDKQEPPKQGYKRFYLLSNNILDANKNGFIPKSIATTFIDVNESYMMVYTGIIWYFEDSLIKLVKTNTFEIIISPRQQWQIETYQRGSVTGFKYESEREANMKSALAKRGLFIDGLLIFQLLGGLEKLYPATQMDAKYFIESNLLR